VIERRAVERGFRPDIQGLRAIAVTMVVIYHLYPSFLPGGFVGVDVFFVISGFLITGHLWRGYQRSGRVRLLDFWGRRAKRLIPAAALVLAVTWAVARFVLPASQLSDTAEQVRASALYYQNWLLAHNAVDYLTSSAAATPVQHFWSLSVEEQFYLVWPLLFVVATLAARRHRPWRVIVGLMVVLVAASLAYSVYDTRVNPSAAYFVTPARMWELGMGGLLAMLLDRPDAVRQPGRYGRLDRLEWLDRLECRGWLGWAGLSVVLTSPFALRGTTAFPGALALLPGAGAVMVIGGGPDQGPARLISTRPFVFLGGISYSLYLWHWPVIDLWTAYWGKAPGILSGAVIIAVSVALAWLTKVFVEDPVRLSPKLSGHGWRSLSTVLAAALPVTLVMVYIAGMPVQFNGKLGPGYPGAAALVRTLRVQAEPVQPPPDDAHAGVPEYWRQGCLPNQDVVAPKECVYGDTTNPTLTVALVGDSIAGNWFPALLEIAQRYHWELITDMHGLCTFTATWLAEPGTKGPYTACHEWGVTVLHDLLTSIHPDVVITSDLPDLGSLAHKQAGPQAYADISAGMASYWTQLEDNGISVVPIEETPIMSFNPPDCVAKYGASSSECEEPMAKATESDPPTVRATQLMHGKVKLIDMNKFVCDPTECPSVVGNILIYFDEHHMTSSYSKTMTPYLTPLLFSSSAVLASHR
jgi:peptidoglycan/LPS O-acetylase OafA/YrhL